MNKSLSAILFTNPSFLSGIARVLDLGSTLTTYNYSETNDADSEAIKADWMTVGFDISESVNKYQHITNK